MKKYKTAQGRIRLFHADCIDVLRQMKDNAVDSIITDPPYGLRLLNKAWDYQIPTIEYWQEMLRVAKPGSYLLAFGGERTFHRMACYIEDTGWRLVTTLVWLYTSGMPKGINIGKSIDRHLGHERKIIGTKLGNPGYSLAENKPGRTCLSDFTNAASECAVTAPACDQAAQFEGYNSALKPAFEPILLALKPLSGTFAQNALDWGLAGLNINACRIPLDPAEREKYQRNWHRIQSDKNKESPIFKTGYDPISLRQYIKEGRWPANVIFDTRAAKDFVHAPRYFFCSKASKKERGLHNHHLTVKPLSLMQWLCRLTKPPGTGYVLDPFMGSGTTALACLKENRKFIGVEKEDEYFEIAKRRIREHIDSETA